MDPELAALAVTAATTIVKAMAGDAWEKVKGVVARLFPADKASELSPVVNELEQLRTELLNAQPEATAALTTNLTSDIAAQLRLALLTSPETAAVELRELIRQYGAEIDGSSETTSIVVKGTASGHGRVYQVGQGTQHIK